MSPLYREDPKRELRLSIGYKFPHTCGLCAHSVFAMRGSNPFGICNEHSYDVSPTEKRKLPVHVLGGCPAFVAEEQAVRELGPEFAEFVEEGPV